MKRSLVPSITVCVMATYIIAACASAPPVIPENATPREMFQRAQEAVVERGDYATALHYYLTFIERYPDDVQRRVEAEYEIGFIYYKTGKSEQAAETFEALLARYQAEGAELLPRWPQILATKLLEEIEEKAEE